MKLLYGHNKAVADFVSKLAPHCEAGFGNCTGIGVINNDGLLVGGMVYSGYDPIAGTIEMSGAAINKRWLTKKTLYAFFEYPFEQINCQMVFMRNAATQASLHRMLRAYGFEEFLIKRMYGREEDGHLWTLTDDDWKQNKFMKGRKNV